jgi:hypothetical protein
MRAPVFRIAVCLAALLLLAAAEPPAEEKPGVSFTFAPSPGTYRESLRVTREFQLGEAEPMTEVTSIERVVNVRATVGGFTFDLDPVEVVNSVGDEVRDNPLLTRVEASPLRFEVNSKGQVQDVHGYQEVTSELRAELGESRAEKLGAAVDPEVLTRRAMDEWQVRIGDLAGNRFEIGEILVSKESMDLPGGGIATVHLAMRIEGTEPCGGVECARIEMAYASDPADLAGFVGATPDEARKVLGSRDRTGATITGEGTRLLETGTMRLHEEEIVRVMERSFDVPGQGLVPAHLEDRRRTTWDYGAVKE